MLSNKNLEQLALDTDEKLIEQIKTGNADAFSVLLARYENFLKHKASTFYSPNTQQDDFVQEAILSFFKTVKTYDGTKSSFSTYLNVCVTHALVSYKRKIARIEASIEDETVEETAQDPQSIVENQERVNALITDIERLLSGFELKALTLYLGGKSYDAIARELGATRKSVDNALQRVRLKLKNRSLL